METSPAILNKPPPPFPAPPRSVDFSFLVFILSLLAFMTVPALIYAVFFAIKCPPSLFRYRPPRRRTSPAASDTSSQTLPDVMSDVKYNKEAHVKELGTECPVCLSGFDEGEEVRQLGVCKHSFHGSCINMWLKDHANCPICRAIVAVDRSRTAASSEQLHGDDLQQGLPDASAMV